MLKEELQSFVAELLCQFRPSSVLVDLWANGATSTVWKVRAGGRSYAFRIVHAEGRGLDGDLEASIRAGIAKRGGRTVETVMNSQASNILFDGKPWSLDTFVEGTHPKRGELPDAICRNIGETLAAVHELPTGRFGKPSRFENGKLIGQKLKPMQGIKQRFENPLPETWERNFVHPIIEFVPDILPRLVARLQEVSDIVSDGGSVLCHSDVHEKQLICVGDDLRALIDFGDATVLDRNWDFGSIFYFHGRQCTASVLDAYKGALGRVPVTMDTAALFSLAVAMHHGSRSRILGKEHRLGRAINHIRQVVSP